MHIHADFSRQDSCKLGNLMTTNNYSSFCSTCSILHVTVKSTNGRTMPVVETVKSTNGRAVPVVHVPGVYLVCNNDPTIGVLHVRFV